MDSQEFIEKCRELVADYTNAKLELKGLKLITHNDVYVVWSTKVLQNNKAMLSTPFSDGMYYELTFNGHKNELYFDAYKKTENIKYDI